MTRGPSDRSHLSIGEVLSLLQDEFPDVTISKIRFLESQGLLDPERTPSGYRKFYDDDIERLRWILRQQKEHYLPLKVIKDRLDGDATPTAPGAPRPVEHGPSTRRGRDRVASPRPATNGRPMANGHGVLAVDDRRTRPAPVDEAPPSADGQLRVERRLRADEPVADGADGAGHDRPGRGDAARAAADPPDDRPPAPGAVPPPADPPPVPPAPSTAPPAAAPAGTAAPGAAPSPPDVAATLGQEPGSAVSLTIEELAEVSDMSVRDLRELERYGLLESHVVGDAAYYGADDLVVARTAGGFLRHGIEARHLRSYKVAVDREAGLLEQIVLPLLKQRNAEAHRLAGRNVTELMHLGEVMRSVLLRRELRDHIEP